MSETAVRLMSEIEKLSLKERAELAYLVLESLDGPSSANLSDEEFEAELNRRADEIDSGTAVGRPANVVLDELRNKYS